MPDPVEELQQELHAIERRAEALVRSVDARAFSWTPAPGRWSIGQCLQHLNLAAAYFVKRIDRAIDGGVPARDPADVTKPGFAGRTFLRYMEPPHRQRVKAPKAAQPEPELSMPDVIAGFASAQRALGERIERARSVDLNRTKMKYPVVPIIRFSLGEIFGLVLSHERRHLWQAENVKNDPEFPSASASKQD